MQFLRGVKSPFFAWVDSAIANHVGYIPCTFAFSKHLNPNCDALHCPNISRIIHCPYCQELLSYPNQSDKNLHQATNRYGQGDLGILNKTPTA